MSSKNHKNKTIFVLNWFLSFLFISQIIEYSIFRSVDIWLLYGVALLEEQSESCHVHTHAAMIFCEPSQDDYALDLFH